MASFAYILSCADGKRYYGSTSDLRRRLAEHHTGQVRSTKGRRPVALVWYETFETPAQARQRERSFKHGLTRRKTIEWMIAMFPKSRLAPFA